MLVLTVQSGRTVEIKAPDTPTIFVKNLEPHPVRLGFEAPTNIQIIREEANNKEPKKR